MRYRFVEYCTSRLRFTQPVKVLKQGYGLHHVLWVLISVSAHCYVSQRDAERTYRDNAKGVMFTLRRSHIQTQNIILYSTLTLTRHHVS
jgi:hypothetical protein